MKIEISRAAAYALRKSNKRQLLAAKIAELASGSFVANPNVVRLQGRTDYRLRVQDWRVIFRIEGDTIVVDAIGPRGSVYEDRS